MTPILKKIAAPILASALATILVSIDLIARFLKQEAQA